MTPEQVIYDRLTASTAITDAVTGIFPVEPPENVETVPVLVYTVSPGECEQYMEGASNITRYGVSIDVYAITLKECLSILQNVKSQLNQWRGGDVLLCRYLSQSVLPLDPGSMARHEYQLVLSETPAQISA